VTDYQTRTQAFETKVRAACPFLTGDGTKLQKALSASNSGALMEGRDLYVGAINLERFLDGDQIEDFRVQACFRFIPDDEVHLMITINGGIPKMRERVAILAQAAKLAKAAKAAKASKEGSKQKINNNVRFFLGTNGQVYLDNEFWNRLPPLEELAPGIPVARLDYAIWSPAAEVRGLAATEFTNFLAKTVGKEIAHPHAPWGAPGTVPEGALPSTPVAPAVNLGDFTIAEIQAGISTRGGHYDDDIVRRFHTAMTFLPRKHFALLAGVSGSGKTSLITRYAHTIHSVPLGESSDPFLFVIPVQPDWTDRSGLLGWFDAIERKYVVPKFLEALLVANANPQTTVVVCLDELNLARVEYYLSDVLSAMETPHPISLHSHTTALDGDNGWQVQPTIRVPNNLLLIGTINVDETTHRIADKVLDRAIYIDTSKVDISGYIDSLAASDPGLATAIAACRAPLESLSGTLAKYKQPFGYRTTLEVLQYHKRAVELGGESDAVLDELLVQKILTKLKGEQSLAPMLEALGKALKSHQRCSELIAGLAKDLENFGTFQAVR